MSGLDQDDNPERRKRTVWLMAGGAASLLLPLLGAVYLHISGSGGANGPSGRNDVFERRETGDKRLVPSQAAVPPSALATPASPLPSGPAGAKPAEAPTGSSLDFIKPGAEMAGKFSDGSKPAAPPVATTAAAPAPAAAPAAAAATAPTAKTPAKKGKKDFVMPKLQPTRGFSSMNGSGGSSKKGAPAAAGPGGADTSNLLNNLPPGAADNPQLQQYLKQQGK